MEQAEEAEAVEQAEHYRHRTPSPPRKAQQS